MGMSERVTVRTSVTARWSFWYRKTGVLPGTPTYHPRHSPTPMNTATKIRMKTRVSRMARV
jgi:hypothetical protein